MGTNTNIRFESSFATDVHKGLTSYPKYLYSKYFYDENGDRLFQKIMEMPEYYLFRAEYELISLHRTELSILFKHPQGFDLIELGAGDGTKTKLLLEEFLTAQLDFTYMPVDISQHALDELLADLHNCMPGVTVKPQQGMYFEVLNELSTFNKRKKVLLVLGSNIGNLLHPQAIEFLKGISNAMSKNDLLFMGFDQKKNPSMILNAYNDPKGLTAEFNKNILHRINRELEGNFEPEHFDHWETYDPETGTAKSFLIANKAQKVELKKIGLHLNFEIWETIHTEISQKYDDRTIQWLAGKAGLNILQSYDDPEQLFRNYVFTKE
ncbi:L-histidine N(alpha)-methyltransferase [Robertkochia solimangrovi]|uniref:L-histidine N(alpha)-methyltransferase n=1 Tax=Robertkochia solimangrovi TaxID=2213046 RepID=UPI00117CBC82|nr:L-histidine N(alpha)-methyltransferase [Robertkochia solimangrovi]TRZ44410.1 L-histidine N(alpha)-methyltransferase [Robertkochia solimangrovi]